ncbi:MAG: permease-like cell division protein FtsX [Candidatus Pacebacteria bacterium]|nr:permease-like cell division protein FtsX [Candidatus Paceibacterota bacterium]
MWLNIKRVIKSGFLNFKRGGLVSFASVLVVTVTLAVITTLVLLQAVLTFSLNQIKDKVDVTIYFTTGASEDKILTLKSSLEQLPEVREVTYTSAKVALENFRKRHEGDYPTIAALDEIKENPLGAFLNVRAKEVSQYESIANFLKSDNALVIGTSNIIDKVNYYQNQEVIERLNSIIKGSERLGLIVTLLLIAISIVVTFNTIRLTIFISKDEIGIMRLVGASKMRVTGPFMVEGAIYGIIGAILTLVLFLPATSWVGRNMTGFLGLNVYEYYTSHIFYIFGIILISGILLGVVSSLLAITKYLNK